MKTYDFVHLSLLAVEGEVKGKTKLQKTIYFLGLLSDCLDDLGFRAHFYGPYSAEVAEAVSTLESVGFVSVDTAGAGSLDRQGFEMRRTDFRLTEEGRQIAEVKAARNQALFGKLTAAAKAMHLAGDLDYIKLSIAAKTDYMLREAKRSPNDTDFVQLAKQFGWKVSSEQIRDAANYLQQLQSTALVIG